MPDRDVVLEYLNFHAGGEEGEGEWENDVDPVLKATGDFKYLRALAAFYVRLTFDAVDVYKILEPLLLDYRKLKRRTKDGFMLTYMDQFVDDLLTKDRVCGTSLWKLPARTTLEDLDILEERISPLVDELEELDEESDGSRQSGDESDKRSERSSND